MGPQIDPIDTDNAVPGHVDIVIVGGGTVAASMLRHRREPLMPPE